MFSEVNIMICSPLAVRIQDECSIDDVSPPWLLERTLFLNSAACFLSFRQALNCRRRRGESALTCPFPVFVSLLGFQYRLGLGTLVSLDFTVSERRSTHRSLLRNPRTASVWTVTANDVDHKAAAQVFRKSE